MCECDFTGEAFVYGRDYRKVAFGVRPNNRFGLDDPEESPFDDELYESARTVRLSRGWDYWDKGRARPRKKEKTLRSWRDQNSYGGPRKAIARVLDRRAPTKPIIIVPFDGASKFYLMG